MGLTEKCSTVFSANAPEDFLMEVYQASVDSGELMPDEDQAAVMRALQSLYDAVLSTEPVEEKSRSLLSGLFFVPEKKLTKPAVEGLYIWGGVGRGKTHLVDSFYKLLPIAEKQRLHFYRFMQLVHEELGTLKSEADPLKVVAKNIAKSTQVLVLDEMHVNDITDAMLLGRLFEYLFEQGVVLVTTSNLPPSDLYKNGLQRQRFLPAIALLEKHTKVLEIGGKTDYRSRTLQQSGVYHQSSGEISEKILVNEFHQLTGIEMHSDRRDIIINKRRLPVKMWSDGVVWFDFDELCNTPRSAEDYNQISTFFNTVMVSDIPVMDSLMDDAARRFIVMIDAFYDAHVNLVVSAEAKPDDLYTGSKLAFEFTRTASRLREMQSQEYIGAGVMHGHQGNTQYSMEVS